MDVLGIDHVAIVSDDVNETAELFEDLLGIKFGERIEYTTETIGDDQKLEGRLSNGFEGFDLVSPRDGEENAVQDYLDSHGPGFYGLALRVRDIERALKELHEKEVEPIGHIKNADFVEYFFHPNDFGGIFMVLAETAHPFESNFKTEEGQSTE